MKIMTRILRISLFLILLLCCLGCQSEHTDTQTDRQPQIPSGVWEMSEPLTLPGESTVMGDRGFARDTDGNIYCTAAAYRFSTDMHLLRYAPDDTLTALSYPDGGFASQPPYLTSHVLCFTTLPDGGFATVFDIGQTEMLVITDADNRITAQTELPHFGTIHTVEHIIYAPAQGTLYIGSGDGFAAYTTGGVLLWTYQPSYPIIGLGIARDGTGYVCAYDLLTDITVISVRPLDNTAQRLGEPYLLPEAVNLMNADLIDHPAYDLCWNVGDVIWGCDFLPVGTDAKTVMPMEIINLLNSDISTMTLTNMIFLSEDEALMFSSDYRENISESQPYYARLSRVPKERLTPVFEITVAACGAGMELLHSARAFNAAQNDFRVVFRSYDTYGLDDAEKPRAAFETDLVTGNIPDIILGNGFFRLDDYVHLGIFADMYSYLDADPDFGRDDLHACVLKPFESSDGTLPYLANTFYVATVEATAASAEQIPDDWTFADAAALADAMEPDGMLFYVTGDNGMALLEKLLPPTVTGIFADCTADRDALSSLLSFCRDYKTADTLSAGDRKQMQIDGTLLTVLQTHLQNPYHYLESRYGVGQGAAPVYVGFPSAPGSKAAGSNGAAVSMREGFAITTEASGHELASRGAWEFIRYVLENHTYTSSGTRVAYFGAAKASLDAFFDSADTTYCIHWNPDRAELSYYFPRHTTHEDEPVLISFDEEDRAAIRDLLSGITTRTDAYPTVCSIIYEEASAYFAGAKTLAQTVDIIASRAELYFSERE